MTTGEGRWERVETLFTQALERPATERASFVAATSDDPELSGTVLSLLRAHDARGRLDSIADRLGRPRFAPTLSATEVLQRLGTGLRDRYRVKRELGRGGMAIVLLAHDLKHRRNVALKVLHPDLALSIGSVRFLREIAIAAQLTHPHILPLHDSGEAGGLLYYVMPYVEGESLRDRLRREERLAIADALEIARQIAGALSYAHSHDVIHRDIKPENILLEAGHAVVSDFGIARAMTAAGGDELSETGIVLGTPAYMSPEQAVGAHDVDRRSDIYSLACVLYEMLAGRPPFTGETVEEVLHQHLTAPPPELQAARDDTPEQVASAVHRALAKTPNKRFVDAASFADALPLPGAVAAARSRWRSAVLTGVALVAATIGTATVLASRHSRTDPLSVIAVLPLVPTARDTGLARLGRDLVVTLSADLDAVQHTRAVDALTVLAQTRESGPLALQPGIQLAGLLGAASVVHGAIVRTGADVRIDVGLFRTDDGQPVARASVTADPSKLTVLTDSLVATLLRSGRAHAKPVPELASITTASLPALQAFLEGEHAMLDSRWEDAARAYVRAIHADSTFWLAYWRYAYAREWYLNLDPDSLLEALKAHRAALPDRDRLVFESWLTDTIALALARAREAVDRYPDYWPGWMQYGDWLFHSGPVYGHDESEAQAALERAVALNPEFTAAWEHLFWVSLARDTVAAGRALAALERLDFSRAVIAEFGFDVSRVYRADLGLSRSGTLDRPLLDSIASDLLHIARGRIGSGANLLRTQVELSERVLRRNPSSALAAVHERLLADAWAGRGAWDSAVAVAERLARHSPGDALDGYRLAVIGAWVGALPPDVAKRARALPAQMASRSDASAGFRSELAWLDGVLAAVTHDRSALADARARVHVSDTLPTPVLDGSLTALDQELSGARREAARALATLNWTDPDVLAPAYATHPYVIAISRLAAAKWLRLEGDSAAARRAAMWFDAAWALDGYRPARKVLGALAELEAARGAEARGDTSAARSRYEAFLRRYDSPVGPHLPYVQEARTAVARLRL